MKKIALDQGYDTGVFHRGQLRVATSEYWSMMGKRTVWAEGSFSVLKREPNLSAIRKQGFLAAMEECLLTALAFNATCCSIQQDPLESCVQDSRGSLSAQAS
jgi:hypothetical protein